jgi:hypothetical protein
MLLSPLSLLVCRNIKYKNDIDKLVIDIFKRKENYYGKEKS